MKSPVVMRWKIAACSLGLLTWAGVCAQQSSQPASQPANQADSSPFHLELNVNRVQVPVVVLDGHGHALPDLKAEDFQVFDEGKLRSVSSFTVEKRDEADNAAAKMPEKTVAAPGGVNAVPETVILPDRITVFLFDDMHLSVEDLAQARQAGAKVIAEALHGSDMAAVVSISGRVNTGLTHDLAKLEDALTKLRPLSVYRPDSMGCPFIDYYEADLIENKHDSVAVQDANRKLANCNPALPRPQDISGGSNSPTAENEVEAAARQALELGNRDVQATYAGIAEFVRRLALLPGHRTLILVSSGFLNIARESLSAESQVMDLAIKSNVVISALDARGLYTTGITASQHSPALGGPSLMVNAEYHGNAMKLAENPLAELADGTGGTFFHNRNDLDNGLRDLAEAPECIYVLELSLDGVKQNGTFHKLKVKVDRKSVQVKARAGYFMPNAAKRKK